jgi:hypothetical protein
MLGGGRGIATLLISAIQAGKQHDNCVKRGRTVVAVTKHRVGVESSSFPGNESHRRPAPEGRRTVAQGERSEPWETDSHTSNPRRG